MKIPFNIKLVTLYLWIALAFCVIWSLHDLSTFPFNFFEALLNNVWRVVFVVVLDFVFFEYTVPFVIAKRKYVVYNILIAIPVLFLYMILWSFGLASWRRLGIELNVYTPYVIKGSSVLEAQMAFSVSSVCFFGIIRHIYNYVKLKQSTQQLRIEKQEAELNFLRSQTNPHFLFNTLNNIYSLSRDKSNLAPESILRLSKILRYMLYETGGSFVAVEQELKIITDYIELEKLRYDESLKINFNNDVEDMKQALPPLLLIPLVENAFKHGVSETRSNPFIDIHLSINNRQLKFIVKNSTEEMAEQKTVKGNIGLSNLRRQLELLYSDYDLFVAQNNSGFIATLKINLATHV